MQHRFVASSKNSLTNSQTIIGSGVTINIICRKKTHSPQYLQDPIVAQGLNNKTS
jgi:hypothetical protein